MRATAALRGAGHRAHSCCCAPLLVTWVLLTCAGVARLAAAMPSQGAEPHIIARPPPQDPLPLSPPPPAAAATRAGACEARGGGAPLPLLEDLPDTAAQGLGAHTLAFLALADMAYSHDHLSPIARRSPAPCLAAWGAAAPPAAVGGRGFVFRTRRDVFVALRGMDGLGELPHFTKVQPVYDAAFFGAPPPARAPPPELPLAAYRTRRPLADPNLFWVLRRDYEDARDLDAPVLAAVEEQLRQMDAAARPAARVWLTGHSSGGALAQLLTLRLALALGPARVGGVLLFNSDRAGSAGFAAHYDSLLGDRTLRVGYGADNANLASNMAMGLRFPGRGVWACPVPGRPREALVELPLGGDRVDACKGLSPPARAADLETWDDVAERWRLPFLGRMAVMSTVAEWDSFAHHFPHLLWDSLLRALGGRIAACALRALREPACVVSRSCAAAVRPAGDARCLSCADDSTCSEYWGLEGYRCDNWPSLTRSGLCYRPPPLGLPPTLAGLFWMRSSNATADAGPPAAADGVAARPPAAAGDAGGPWEVTATAGEAPFPDPS